MILILDGPEAAGKTMLAEKLAERSGFPYIHNSIPKGNYDMVEMYAEMIRTNNDAIIDRCWYSEMVYGPIMRGESRITQENMIELEQLVVQNGGGMIIHCTDIPELLWERAQQRGEDYIKDFHTLQDLKQGFESLFNSEKHLLPVVRYELSYMSFL